MLHRRLLDIITRLGMKAAPQLQFALKPDEASTILRSSRSTPVCPLLPGLRYGYPIAKVATKMPSATRWTRSPARRRQQRPAPALRAGAGLQHRGQKCPKKRADKFVYAGQSLSADTVATGEK